MSNSPPLEIKVWGDYACFTRPEFGVERVSYEIMTPSAARGVLSAIFWKPEFDWCIQEIQILPSVMRDIGGKPLALEKNAPAFQHFSILRNEINKRQSDQAARGWTKEGDGYYADEDRAQRHTLALRDVAYIIKAQICLKPHANAHINKYIEQFTRRVKRGQCHHQPYFGTREFSAYFSPPDSEKPVQANMDLGLMLFDLEFTSHQNGAIEYFAHDENGARVIKGNAKPKFFQAKLEQGIMKIPAGLYGGGR
jgi:CRISPR-associated protein Cas5d